MNRFGRLSRSSRLTIVALATVLSLVGTGVALAVASPAIQTITPRRADQITNIDVLRQQIKNYYGDALAVTGPTGTWASPLNLDSNYADEAASVATRGGTWLHLLKRASFHRGMRALILDVDDTTLATWSYELYSNWDYNPPTNATFVLGEKFPAVPGMVAMARRAARDGYAIFVITGRPASQEAATLANLTTADVAGGIGAGYPAPTKLNNGEDGLFTKPAIPDYPQYLTKACAAELAASKSCTTIHYKSATRAHIESLGYDIVANFGDQYSDLKGGHADRTFKLPNPNYFLP